MRTAERLFRWGSLFAGAAIYASTYAGEPERLLSAFGRTAMFYPRIILGIWIAISVLLVVGDVMNKPESPGLENPLRLAGAIVLTALVGALMPYLGFLPCYPALLPYITRAAPSSSTAKRPCWRGMDFPVKPRPCNTASTFGGARGKTP